MTRGPYLLDINVLIELFSKKQETVELLVALKKHGLLVTSLMSVAEIRRGWSDKDARVYLPLLYDLFGLLNLSHDIAQQAGAWRREYRENGITLSMVDTLIAATAYCNDLCIVTRNTRQFPMPEVRLFRQERSV
jgi:predicted nucleic acid-binding protein